MKKTMYISALVLLLTAAFKISLYGDIPSDIQTIKLFHPAKWKKTNPSVAVFAGGCFWCVEAAFEKKKGVYDAVSGYTGGKKKFPTYGMVSSGMTSHYEAVAVYYNPAVISYKELLAEFWRSINPTQANGQFYDIGHQYQTAVFYRNDTEKEAALKSKAALEKSKRFSAPIVTPVLPASHFYRAEEYHQDYYKKNPSHYNAYARGSGRIAFRKKYWSGQ